MAAALNAKTEAETPAPDDDAPAAAADDQERE